MDVSKNSQKIWYMYVRQVEIFQITFGTILTVLIYPAGKDISVGNLLYPFLATDCHEFLAYNQKISLLRPWNMVTCRVVFTFHTALESSGTFQIIRKGYTWHIITKQNKKQNKMVRVLVLQCGLFFLTD